MARSLLYYARMVRHWPSRGVATSLVLVALVSGLGAPRVVACPDCPDPSLAISHEEQGQSIEAPDCCTTVAAQDAPAIPGERQILPEPSAVALASAVTGLVTEASAPASESIPTTPRPRLARHAPLYDLYSVFLI